MRQELKLGHSFDTSNIQSLEEVFRCGPFAPVAVDFCLKQSQDRFVSNNHPKSVSHFLLVKVLEVSVWGGMVVGIFIEIFR